MKTKSRITKTILVLLASSILLTSCTSMTMIQSKPSGAKVFIDGQPVGQTPHTHRDTKIVGSCTNVRIEKEGYETFNTNICRNEEADVGAIIGGIFFLVPFLWTMKYKPYHTYELTPSKDIQQQDNVEPSKENTNTKSKADRLRELNELLDEDILTQEEYEKEKKKILEEE